MNDTSGRPRKVLVIDDEPSMVELMLLILSQGDIEVSGTVSGSEGLEMMEEIRPDLVMVDDMMPGMHGHDVNERMKASDTLRDIPVVLLTAKIPSAIAPFRHRFRGVLYKPFSPEEFFATVAEALDICPVVVEVGQERTLAEVLDWPGWCRSGPDEASALQALFDVGPRYARALQAEGITCDPPKTIADMEVLRRREQTAPSEFFDPMINRYGFFSLMMTDERTRFETILRAGWQTFADVVDAAAGRGLAHGPDSDPRDLDHIVEHVLHSSHEYLAQIGWPLEPDPDAPFAARRDRLQAAMIEGLSAPAKEAPHPPPDDQRWPTRYFMRRAVWHLFDHAWEIEDRLQD